MEQENPITIISAWFEEEDIDHYTGEEEEIYLVTEFPILKGPSFDLMFSIPDDCDADESSTLRSIRPRRSTGYGSST